MDTVNELQDQHAQAKDEFAATYAVLATARRAVQEAEVAHETATRKLTKVQEQMILHGMRP